MQVCSTAFRPSAAVAARPARSTPVLAVARPKRDAVAAKAAKKEVQLNSTLAPSEFRPSGPSGAAPEPRSGNGMPRHARWLHMGLTGVAEACSRCPPAPACRYPPHPAPSPPFVPRQWLPWLPSTRWRISCRARPTTSPPWTCRPGWCTGVSWVLLGPGTVDSVDDSVGRTRLPWLVMWGLGAAQPSCMSMWWPWLVHLDPRAKGKRVLAPRLPCIGICRLALRRAAHSICCCIT